MVGALSLRTRGVYFIMVTLAFAQMAYFVFHDTALGGGSDGIYMNMRPGAAARSTWRTARCSSTSCWARWSFTYGLLALIRRSRFGAALAGIRVNEQRMRAAGFPVYGYKLAAFVIAGALAGLAGFLVASRDGVVNPELLAWHNSGEVLLMIILGGLGHLRGAVIGAVAFTLLKELLSTHAIVGPLADHWQLTLGLAIIAFVALLPKGIDRHRGCGCAPKEAAGMSTAAVEVETLTRRFGGLVAVNAVSLDLHRGEVHAVIGTNGAGKSTLINMLSGEIDASDGRITLDGEDITKRAQFRRALRRRGPQLPAHHDLSGVHACWRTAASPRRPRSPRPWAIWQSSQQLRSQQCRRARSAAKPQAWPPWPAASPAP